MGVEQNDKTLLLPESYELRDDDVLCGRGTTCYNHTGNQRFRQLVASHLDEYARAKSKMEKSVIISSIVDTVRAKSGGLGGFVRRDPLTGQLSEVGDFLAREKTSQAFRDALQFQYRSSNAFKQQQRAASKPKLQRKLSESVLDCRPSKKDTKCKRSVSDPGTDGSTDFLFQFKDFEDYASVTPSASDASVQNQIWPHVTKSFTKSAGVVAMETNEKQTQPELSRSACFVQPNDRDGGGALQAILQPQPVFPRSIQPNIAAIPSLFQQKDLADPVVPVAPTSASIQQTSAALPLVYERLTGCPAGTELATQVDTNDASLFEMLFKITEGDQSAVASAEDPYEPAPIEEASSRD